MRSILCRIRCATTAALVIVASCTKGSTELPVESDLDDAASAVESAAELVDAELVDAPLTVPAVGPALSPAEWSALQVRIESMVDTVDLRLRDVRGLSAGERQMLRRDVNAIQIARARQLGIKPTTNLAPLVSSGQLVRLAESNRYWTVRELDYSIPYVTPSAEAMLVEIGKRFHARLDALNVPRYRLDITSVLRTPQTQKALRRTNGNASARESAHEFGTTLDIAYRRFAPPAPDPKRDGMTLNQQAQLFSDSLMVKTGNTRSGELQAVLGRVLREMQQEGKLMVRMERRQTVYHITVARPLPPVRHSQPSRTRSTPVKRAGR